LPSERTVRLVTGIILFSYAGCHFLSHATGVFHLEAMETFGRGMLLAPWRTWVGLTALFGSLFVHGGLGLRALIRRRHLRMPAIEAWQLGLGLSIPLLLIPHVANVRLGSGLYGLDDSYYRLIYQYWITTPGWGLPRQFFLLLAVWLHGCIGFHMFLRFRPWYGRVAPALAFVAILIPFLAILGISNAGWDAALRVAVSPGFAESHGPPAPGTAGAAHLTALESLWDDLRVAYLVLLVGVFAYRIIRHRRDLRLNGVRIIYPGRPAVTVPKGSSVLEASRLAGIPHVSVCGGRGRCSTCRIKITRGHDGLPAPSAIERATLDRVKAPELVRLACQLRPHEDVGVVPLIHAPLRSRGLRIEFDEGRELTVTALCVDLRDSTGLAAGKLPFDTLFIVDRYVQCVSNAIERHNGYVTSVAGDSLMSVFGADGNAARGIFDAWEAAASIWEALERLSEDLGDDLKAPLRFGMGMHTGVSVLGSLLSSGNRTLQFLGDTGNVAARLDAINKDLGTTLIMSEACLLMAGVAPPPGLARSEVVIRGRDSVPMWVFHIRRRDEIATIQSQAAALA
jgi:adenylate cyclase